MESTEKTTARTPQQIVLELLRETSCRFLHVFFHGWQLSWGFIAHWGQWGQSDSAIEGSTRRNNSCGWAQAPWMIHASCVVSKRWGWSALWVWACPCAPDLEKTWFALIFVMTKEPLGQHDITIDTEIKSEAKPHFVPELATFRNYQNYKSKRKSKIQGEVSMWTWMWKIICTN